MEKPKKKQKRVLDSVHGYITIPEELCDNIIDTPYFQRLRRVEQTSCRSLFPSARHDRFIHSLGVYHLGTKIVESIRKNCPDLPGEFDDLAKNYEVACLLHDVCHTPFSHTFEDYYEKEKKKDGEKDGEKNSLLIDTLRDTINSEAFSRDWKEGAWKSAVHERLSAIMAITCFPDYIKQPDFDLEFIARMIVGCKYGPGENKSLQNAFIELLHGKVFDADGLDYVCRDAAMAGYCTNTIDVDRLVSGIYLVKDDHSIFEVCFSNKVINEIESVLGVKHFQQYNVFAHHIVAYEQELLKEAMKSAASLHLKGKNEENPDERKKSLRALCDYKAFTERVVFGINKVSMIYPSDDDFVTLMKYYPEEYYIKQWLTRNYELQPLWKSKSEFSHLFRDVLPKDEDMGLWVFSKKCVEFLKEKYGIPESKVWMLSHTFKDRYGDAKKVSIYIGGKIKKYEELYPKGRLSFNDLEEFKYLFVPKSLDKEAVLKTLIEEQKKYKDIVPVMN